MGMLHKYLYVNFAHVFIISFINSQRNCVIWLVFNMFSASESTLLPAIVCLPNPSCPSPSGHPRGLGGGGDSHRLTFQCPSMIPPGVTDQLALLQPWSGIRYKHDSVVVYTLSVYIGLDIDSKRPRHVYHIYPL